MKILIIDKTAVLTTSQQKCVELYNEVGSNAK